MRTLHVLALAVLLAASTPTTPAAAQIQINGELVHTLHITPDTVYTGILPITNTTDEPQQVRLYQKDFQIRERASYTDPGAHARSNAAWLRLPGDVVTVPPRSTMPVEYALVVPALQDGAPLSGTYWSAIMVEGTPREEKVTDTPVVFMHRVRYAVQIAAHVTGTGQAQLRIDAPAIVENEGTLAFEFVIENDGDRAVRPEVVVEFYDAQGVQVAIERGGHARMYPGARVRKKVSLIDVPAGTYTALLLLDAGDADVFGAQFRLDIPAAPPPTDTTGTSR